MVKIIGKKMYLVDEPKPDKEKCKKFVGGGLKWLRPDGKTVEGKPPEPQTIGLLTEGTCPCCPVSFTKWASKKTKQKHIDSHNPKPDKKCECNEGKVCEICCPKCGDYLNDCECDIPKPDTRQWEEEFDKLRGGFTLHCDCPDDHETYKSFIRSLLKQQAKSFEEMIGKDVQGAHGWDDWSYYRNQLRQELKEKLKKLK